MHDNFSEPEPKYSTMEPVPPFTVKIPATFKAGNTPQMDRKYSGRYVIVGVRHHTGDGLKMKTELLLARDSMIG